MNEKLVCSVPVSIEQAREAQQEGRYVTVNGEKQFVAKYHVLWRPGGREMALLGECGL